jgi:heme exporter protein D
MEISIFSIHWSSLSEFFAMGGYGFYVWGSFLTSALLLCIEVVQAKRAWHDELRDLAQAYELDEGLAQMHKERS